MESAYTIVFFQRHQPATHLVLLERSPQMKKFARRWTGLGGQIKPGESPSAGAYREVKEESGIADRELVEFARCIINWELVLYYFVGVDDGDLLPASSDGVLGRVSVENVFDLPLLGTDRRVLDFLRQRGWDTSRPFTLIGQRQLINDPDDPLERVVLHEGLHNMRASS